MSPCILDAASMKSSLCIIPYASVPFFMTSDFIKGYDVQLKHERKSVALGLETSPKNRGPNSGYQGVPMQIAHAIQWQSVGPSPNAWH